MFEKPIRTTLTSLYLNRKSSGPTTYGKIAKVGNSKPTKSKSNSAFLLHHYPDGQGPDTELIETLEKEVVDTNPNVSFDDIAELDDAKRLLQEAVLLPLMMPELFTGIRRPWKGVLLYGPPGTGKTMLAKALATQGKTTFFNVSASSLASKWKGESEKLVRLLFEMAHFYAPTTIFIDEVDSIGSKRGSSDSDGSRKVKSELLIQMDGANASSSAGANEKQEGKERKQIMVLGATNRPWDLDEALRRRFEKRVYVALPAEIGRKRMFEINLANIKLEENIDWDKMVDETKGFSGADIAILCREAAFMPMRKKLLSQAIDPVKLQALVNSEDFKKEIDVPLTMDDFKEALKNSSKTVSEADLVGYAKWAEEFKSI